jgi:UDP-N-acetylglucosamine 2-epimerase (non-hydrolysing)
VFTGSRADAGPLGPVCAALDESPDADLVVIATGSHLDAARGSTLDALTISPASALEVVDAHIGSDAPEALAAAFGPIATGVADALRRHRADVMVVLGDRWELLAAVGAAMLLQVPVAHLHGGEITEGALDDRVRHAVTKLADLHLCATDEYRDRILQLGEERWRVHVTGAPALDRFTGVERESAEKIGRRIGAPVTAPWGLVTYHAPTVDRVEVRERARAVFEVAAGRLASVVITYPGLDPGGNVIIEEIERVSGAHAHVHAVRSLGEAYPSALASADVMVGNSSSGVIEAASFRLPVVDVGDRQRGRTRPANVIHAEDDRDSIAAAIDRALDPAFRGTLDGLVNPYGTGHAAEHIVAALLDAPLDRLARKRFVDHIGGIA